MLTVDLSIRGSDGQAVVALRGELSLADTRGVASHLIVAVASCGRSVIVDLAGLEAIGYSGPSVLLRVRKWTRQSGGDLLLAAPQQPVRHILEATGLIDVFLVYPSVEEAANSTRQAQAWSPAAPQRLHAAVVTRSGDQRPVCRAARRGRAGRCPGAERADRTTLRVRPALSGARREGQPRPDRSRPHQAGLEAGRHRRRRDGWPSPFPDARFPARPGGAASHAVRRWPWPPKGTGHVARWFSGRGGRRQEICQSPARGGNTTVNASTT